MLDRAALGHVHGVAEVQLVTGAVGRLPVTSSPIRAVDALVNLLRYAVIRSWKADRSDAR